MALSSTAQRPHILLINETFLITLSQTTQLPYSVWCSCDTVAGNTLQQPAASFRLMCDVQIKQQQQMLLYQEKHDPTVLKHPAEVSATQFPFPFRVRFWFMYRCNVMCISLYHYVIHNESMNADEASHHLNKTQCLCIQMTYMLLASQLWQITSV